MVILMSTNFVFGDKSWEELKGVDTRLQAVVTCALTLTKQDFTVFDGLRTQEEQMEMIRRGSSKATESKHLTGQAVDLVPYVAGKLRWEWNPIFVITKAVYEASSRTGIQLRWGGVWDEEFHRLNPDKLSNEVGAYIKRRQDAGKRVFVDGVHFELLD